jgi:ribulose-phosphate 3-epimerase
MIIAPSFLTADWSNLETEIRSIQTAPWIHFDVMDGQFVPAKTYGPDMVANIAAWSNQVFDVHLMVQSPEDVLAEYAAAGADLITIHVEAVRTSVKEAIEQIRALGVRVGLSIKPGTDVKRIEPYLEWIDLVLVMSVEPGKGGQPFLRDSLERIAWLKEQRSKRHLQYVIEVDGGINDQTIRWVKEAGADAVVVGSYLFNRTDRATLIEALGDV